MRTLFPCLLLLLSANVLAQSNGEYPAHWWEPVDRDSAPEWEILPQDAEPGEVILSKRNELGLLSNFADTPFDFDGKTYASLEGFWQMMKYPEGPNDPRRRNDLEWPFTREEIAQMVGFDAKRAGSQGSKNMKALNINWVSYKGQQMPYRILEKGEHYKLIRRAMQAKLKQNKNVQDVLKKTGDLLLRPDHSQGDTPPPAWQYHQIWMELRAEL